jgi:hypothetical protein
MVHLGAQKVLLDHYRKMNLNLRFPAIEPLPPSRLTRQANQ